MTPTVRTDRLVFAPYRPQDEQAFVDLLAAEEIWRWMGETRLTEQEVRAVFHSILDDVYAKDRFDVWGLWHDGECVGHAEIKKTGNVDGYEIIAALRRPWWGKGMGSEVVLGLLRYGAEHLGLDRVYGMVGAENAASLAMCERLGFEHVRDVVGDDGGVTKMVVLRADRS